jgi:DNA-binding NarL/FixJ family response regulator
VTVRVLLVHEDPTFCEHLAHEVAGDVRVEIVARTGDGREVRELATQLRVDVTLLQVHLRGDAGAARLTAALRGSECEVLLLVESELDDDVFAAFRAGAAGCMLRSAPAIEIVDALCAVAAGNGALSTELAGQLLRSGRLGARRRTPEL